MLKIAQEIGITGGEEDGVNNEDVDNNSLYTQPEDILAIYKALSPISPYFSIAAGFGNVHGVYKPGNVKLHPELLGKHQKYVKDAIGAKEDKPVFLVFHGGSGSSKKEYLDAIGYGVVKVNLDTDLQYAYLAGIRDYILNKKDYLMKQVGNPDGEDKPNKKYFDPRFVILRSPFHKLLTKRFQSLGSRRREDYVRPCCRGSQRLQHCQSAIGLIKSSSRLFLMMSLWGQLGTAGKRRT